MEIKLKIFHSINFDILYYYFWMIVYTVASPTCVFLSSLFVLFLTQEYKLKATDEHRSSKHYTYKLTAII